MKRNLLPIVALSLLFALPAFAQDTADSSETNTGPNDSSRPAIRTEQKDQREALREEMKDKRGELKEQTQALRTEFKVEIAKMRLANAVRVFTATANRLDRIVARIESRISKIEAAGGKVDDIQDALDLGKENLAEARAEIEVFAGIELSSATSNTTAKALFDEVKVSATKAKASLKAAHASLVKTITLIKGMERTVKVPEEAETETETETEN